MKYEGQDQQYRKGAWVGDNVDAPTTRQLERKLRRIHNKASSRQWQESSYPNEQAQQAYSHADRNIEDTTYRVGDPFLALAAVLGAGARRPGREA